MPPDSLRRPGGFRTRHRVRWVRVLARWARRLPDLLYSGIDAEWDQVPVDDWRRLCPHPPHRRTTVGWGTMCLDCTARVPAPAEADVRTMYGNGS